MQYNTVVSAAMKMLNALEDARLGTGDERRSRGESVSHPAAHAVPDRAAHHARAVARARLSPPISASCSTRPWPQPDPAALAQDEIEIVVQVNGKVRGVVRVPASADDAAIERAALADHNVQKFVEGKPLKFSKILRERKLITLVV